jgi:hypothetical protein
MRGSDPIPPHDTKHTNGFSHVVGRYDQPFAAHADAGAHKRLCARETQRRSVRSAERLFLKHDPLVGVRASTKPGAAALDAGPCGGDLRASAGPGIYAIAHTGIIGKQ